MTKPLLTCCKKGIYKYLHFWHCAVPENIHTNPKEVQWQFQGEGGYQNIKFLKERIKLKTKSLLVLELLGFDLHILEHNLLSVFSTRLPSLPCHTVSNFYSKVINATLCLNWHGVI